MRGDGLATNGSFQLLSLLRRNIEANEVKEVCQVEVDHIVCISNNIVI